MLKQLFAAMNDLLDDIIRYYPKAGGELRAKLDEQICHLRRLSDTIIDEWLQIEEKLARFQPDDGSVESVAKHAVSLFPGDAAASVLSVPAIPAPAAGGSYQGGFEWSDAGSDGIGAHADGDEPDDDGAPWDPLGMGQGYFKLRMFRRAAEYFRQALHDAPDDNLARLFLAMTHMHLREWDEAQRHFLLLINLTDHPKWQALGLNALGCIQAVHANLEQAEHYFLQAHEADPSFEGPMNNLNNCRTSTGQLTLYFGGAELGRP